MQDLIRKIIHVDMDAFFASVEQRDFPEYRALPVAVGGEASQRGVIAAASYEARRYGVKSAMATRTALARCPELILLRPRFEQYKAVSRQIHQIFEQYTDQIEPLSLDEAYLDVTENKCQEPLATRLATQIRAKVLEETGLTASAGISYNKFLAKIASDVNKPNGQFVIPPERAVDFLKTLPISRFYGIGKVTAARMHELGIQTGTDLLGWTELELYQQFGRSGLSYYQLVRGVDHRPIETHWVRKSIASEQTFPQDLLDLTVLQAELHALAVELSAWLEKRSFCTRTVTLKVKYADFTQITRSRTVSCPVQAQADLYDIASALLCYQTEAGVRPIRLLGLSLSQLAPWNESFDFKQLQLF